MAKHQVIVLMGRAEATKSKLNQTRSFWCRKCEAYKITGLKKIMKPHNWMYTPVLRCYAVVTQSVERQPSKLDERVRFPSIAPTGTLYSYAGRQRNPRHSNTPGCYGRHMSVAQETSANIRAIPSADGNGNIGRK